jgi:hypothetical protein
MVSKNADFTRPLFLKRRRCRQSLGRCLQNTDAVVSRSAITSKTPMAPSFTRSLLLKRRRCHQSLGRCLQNIDTVIGRSAVTSKMLMTPSFTRLLPLKRRHCCQSLGFYSYNAGINSDHSAVNSKNTSVAPPSIGHYFRSANAIYNNLTTVSKTPSSREAKKLTQGKTMSFFMRGNLQ